MLFNSIDFAIFLPICFAVYWLLLRNKIKAQNAFLFIASYVFYGWWDWKFLSLIFISTMVDYIVGLKLSTSNKPQLRKLLLSLSILVNIGILFFFKYYNFFVENFVEAFSLFGQSLNVGSLNIILPVGISFYTFQTLSYTIDIYRRKIEPTKDFIAFGAFVSFFPQLVAGPIERASNLLPQFFKKREFNNSQAVDGMRQILWGLFKKIVIADNCAIFADHIFANHESMHGSALVLGALFFTFQIYGDFSGYSDIAIGTAKLFGFKLMQNFAFPYFSRDIAEFWRRWHISLSTWFRDYLYIPLGGSRGSNAMKIRNTFIIFIVSGFWHGANWTFIAWGFLNALYFLPLLLFGANRKHLDKISNGRILPNLRELFSISATFILTVFAWIFFRSESIGMAFEYIGRIFTDSLLTAPEIINPGRAIATGILVIILILVEWFSRDKEYGLQNVKLLKPRALRWIIYYTIIITIYFMHGVKQQFIYFQF